MKNLVNYYFNGQFNEGIITHYSEFCKNHCTSEKCINHYKKMEENKIDEMICPYGFYCKRFFERIYNGIASKELADFSKIKFKIDKSIKLYSSNELSNLIEIDENILFIEEENNLKQKCINDFLHDVNKSNTLIENNIQQISKDQLTSKDKNRLISSLKLTDFFKKRVELYKYVSNPALIPAGKLRERDAFKLFDIYRRIFEEIGKTCKINIALKNIDIITGLEVSGKTIFMANESITILPFLLIDNALKYSNEKSKIAINIYQENEIVKKIEIENYPSYVITENVDMFLERGFRSKNNTSKSSGNGLGLSIVKQICDYNRIDVKLDISSDKNGKQLFKVILIMNEGV